MTTINEKNQIKATDHHTEQTADNAMIITFKVYMMYTIVAAFGIFREILRAFFVYVLGYSDPTIPKKGYATLFSGFDNLWLNWGYGRICECFNRPITGVAGTWINVLERESHDEKKTFQLTGNQIRSLNLGSYNYLGFANKEGPVLESAVEILDDLSTSCSGSFLEAGYTTVHQELEECTAEFLGKESAMIFEMGYATNSTTLPALIGKGGLIISDSLNHCSIVVGCRSSGAQIRTFKHNDTQDLERVLRRSIAEGQPRTHRPWTMILLVVEGIYSMEGAICKLPEIVRLKKKYKTYLYMDEAHSIGATGPNGKGICDHYGVDPADIDILMGTFTKSFGSVGGYIAANKDLIRYLRMNSYGCVYSSSMSPSCARQTLASLRVIMGRDGTDIGRKKLLQLKENSNYVRAKLMDMGCLIAGDSDSPIVPIMLYYPSTYPTFSNMLLARGVAVVVVSYPATAVTGGRARLCISAGHTIEDLDWALQQISEVADLCGVKFCKPREPAFTSLSAYFSTDKATLKEAHEEAMEYVAHNTQA